VSHTANACPCGFNFLTKISLSLRLLVGALGVPSFLGLGIKTTLD
jgi:hypothetical protein